MEPEIVVIASDPAPAPQQAPRPLPTAPVPTKVRRYAERQFQRYDTNGDGVIDEAEQRQMKGNPLAPDYDADGSISLEELTAYTADFGRHRRMRLTGTMMDEAVAALPPLYIPTAERDAMAAAQAAARQQAAQQAAQQGQALPVALVGGPGETNSEAVEEPEAEEESDAPEETAEVTPAGAPSSSKRFVTPPSRLAGVPDWFRAKDTDGDGQLTLAEYAPNSEKALLEQFSRYDRNNDGVLTAPECPK